MYKRWYKRMTALLLAGVTLTMMTGCNGGGTYTGKAYAEDSQYEIEKGAVRTSFVTADVMAKADMWANSNDTAIASVMKKAKKGEKITIAVIGGSITQGTISTGAKDGTMNSKACYANIFYDWWKCMFENTEIEFVNAGIGGTDSYLGVHRVQDEVLSHQPDLVLVEFAVNDADNSFYQTSYDNLLRKIIKSESKPAVMMLIMGQTNGTSAQTKEAAMINAYGIPAISYYAAMSYMIQEGIYTAKDLSGDEVHPSGLGHAITGELLWNYLNEVYNHCDQYGEVKDFEFEPVTEEKYMEADILDSKDITPDSMGDYVEKQTTTQFPNGWQTLTGEESITFTAEFANLGILFQKTKDGLSGQFEVYVDGEKAGLINANFADGWGDAMEGTEVYTSDTKAKHTIEIRKAENSTGDKLNLLGLMVS